MERLIRLGQVVGLLGPGAAVLGLILCYGVNVPFADQWVFVDALGRLRAGGSLWAELFSQHNEHRVVFPKLVLLGLGWLTRWNVVAEMVASVAIASATLLVLLDLGRPVLRLGGRGARVWIPFILSAILFSLAQWQNWLWGWQLAWFLGVFAAVSSIALATRSLQSERSWIWIIGAAAMAIVCQFSLASGIAVWIAAALVLVFHRNRLIIVPLWLTAAGATSAFYFAGYASPAHHPPLGAGLGRPLDVILYLGAYLSGPLGPHLGLGFAAAAVFAIVAVAAFRRHWRRPDLVMPWVAIGAFAGANAAITAIGRVGFGPAQGLESRYVTVALLLTIASVPLAFLAISGEPSRRAWQRRLAIAGATGLTGLVLAADLGALTQVAAFSRNIAAGRDCLLNIMGASDDCLTALYPEPAVVRRLAPPLRVFGLSAFAGPEAPPVPTVQLTGPSGVRAWRLEVFGGTFGWIDSVQIDGDRLTVVGWARHPSGKTASHLTVLIAVDEIVVAEVETSLERADVAAHFHNPDLARSGWMAQAVALPRTTRPRRLQAYLVVNERTLVPVGSERTLPGDP